MRAGRSIRLGTRGSQLAGTQAEWVAGQLQQQSPQHRIELVEIKTIGDRAADARMREIGGEGVFTKEIQHALLAGEVDLAVHSLKDLPTAPVSGLLLAAVPPRAPALDVLIAPQHRDWRSLPAGSRVGTSSPRRRSQLLHLRPDLAVEEIRGNVPTRLRKVDEQGLAAIVLAHAGLHRLGLEDKITYRFTPDEMLPAPGQGALAELRGGCHMPLGTLATVTQGQMHLRATVLSLDGSRSIADTLDGRADQAAALGRQLGERLLAAGAAELF